MKTPKHMIEEIYNSSKGFDDFKNRYIDKFQSVLDSVKKMNLDHVLEEIAECHRRGGKILSMGNGGSAANAAHFCTGVGYVTRNWEAPLRAVCLNQDPLLMSSLANDLGFEEIFFRQVQVLAEKNDLIVAFSVSGNSNNVIKAVEYAKSKGIRTLAFTGSDGGKLLPLADTSLHVKNEDCLFGVTEDIHMIISHIIAYHLEFSFKKSPKI